MPVAVIAHIGSGTRVIGAIGLHAIRHRIVAAGRRRNRHRAVVIAIVVIAGAGSGRIIAGAIALRRDGATDHRAGDGAANQGTVSTAVVTATAAIAAAIKARTAATGTNAAAGAAATGMAAAATGTRMTRRLSETGLGHQDR